MKIAVFAYSRQGCNTARKIIKTLDSHEISAYTMERFSESGFDVIVKPTGVFYGELFRSCDALIFVGSCGIAVREIAPHVKDKKTDPAVVVIDELGRFVVPLLSGHIGGANELARHLAQFLGAAPVITTATDINQKFSVDAWAAGNGFALSNMDMAKAVSAAILEQDVPMMCDFPVMTEYPGGVTAGNSGDVGICISCKITEPFQKTLRVIPKILHLGIGCRRGTEAAAIAEAVEMVLHTHQIDRRGIKCVASIDLKKDEPGLLAYCRENHWPVSFYSARELGSLQGDFTPSDFVSRVTGVDNVCERAAFMGADQLIVEKTACNGVTVAVAAENLEVRFG